MTSVAKTPTRGMIIQMSETEQQDVNVTPVPDDMISITCLSNSFSTTGGTTPQTDVSTFCSDAQEMMGGLPAAGTGSFVGFLAIGDPAFDAVADAVADGLNRLFIIKYTNGTGEKFIASVSQIDENRDLSAVAVQFTASLQLSGKKIYTQGP